MINPIVYWNNQLAMFNDSLKTATGTEAALIEKKIEVISEIISIEEGLNNFSLPEAEAVARADLKQKFGTTFPEIEHLTRESFEQTVGNLRILKDQMSSWVKELESIFFKDGSRFNLIDDALRLSDELLGAIRQKKP